MPETKEELELKIENLIKINNELTDTLEEEKERYSSILEARENTIQSLSAEIASLHESKEATEQELQNTRVKLKNSISSHDKNNAALEESNSEFELIAGKQEQQIALKLEMAKKEVESRENEIKQLEKSFASATSKALEQAQEINGLKDQLEMEKKKNESKEELQMEVERLKEELETTRAKAESQGEEIGALTDQLEIATKEIENKEKCLGEVELENEKMRQLEENFASAKSKAIEQAQEINGLKDQLEMEKKKNESKEELQMEVERLREELETTRAKAEGQGEEITALSDQLDIATKEIEGKEKSEGEVDLQYREELINAKTTIRSLNQANSKLEAKLSNSQTLIETAEVEHQKFKEDIKALKDKIKWLERRRAEERETSSKVSTPRSEGFAREELDKKLQHESLRRTQERIKELEQKVIQVNDEKQKLKHDYDEAVKALEAVDKVYSVREMALQQYKADLEDANQSLKQQSSELLQLKMENDQLKKDYENAEKKKSEHEEKKEELKDEITRTKETVSIYKTEIEEVRKELRDQIHELQIAQAKARERGKKNQILELELKETKETLQISENVIGEKQKNMDSLQESLQNEKKNCKNLEQELEEMFYLKKKLELIEGEKARVVEKLRATESDLNETSEDLNDANKKIKNLDEEIDNLRNDHKIVFEKCEDQNYQIQTLRDVVDSKECDIEQQLIEIIHSKEQLDDLTVQLQDTWATYNADKALWKHSARGGRSIRRKTHSATSKRIPKAPAYQSLPPSKPHSLYHRRLVNKLGEPILNQNYINSTHKHLPASGLQQETTQDTQAEAEVIENKTPPIEGETTPKLSPRPPNGIKPRPVSSYGIRTYPPSRGAKNGEVNGHNGDSTAEEVWMYKDGGSSSNGGDSDEQIVQLLVNTGDRVLIQSKVVGDELLNVSGVVKFVGKVGKKMNSPVYVGLKLDQPFGDHNGVVGGKQIFKCQPRHGKLIKMSDIHAVMQPKTQNYKRVKSLTANW